MTTKKPKFLHFSDNGMQCLTCGIQTNFVGCEKHLDTFPKLTDSSLIRIPVCDKCQITCDDCGTSYSIPRYLEKYETRTFAKPKKKKKIPKTPRKIEKKAKDDKEVTIKQTLLDKLDAADFSQAKELSFFQNASINIFDTLFSVDIGTQLGLKKVISSLDQFDIPFNTTYVQATMDKLTSLLFIMLMIRTTGLGKYEEDIVRAEIERLFKPKDSGKKEVMELLRNYNNLKGEKKDG
jgi:hypothetical protein